MADKPTFKILKSHPVLRVGNNNYFISIQKISNDETGNSSEHFVIKKQGINDDGSLRGQTRQLFIPVDDANEVLQNALNFVI